MPSEVWGDWGRIVSQPLYGIIKPKGIGGSMSRVYVLYTG
ncbi:MAG: hypothetical protein JWN14_757, partial [Chthonomonadales bacterium]|nr:hypothetical protein [Chthonomonadales bacterium]